MMRVYLVITYFMVNWHISVGELTLDVGEPTSHVGELDVCGPWHVGETTGYRFMACLVRVDGEF